eukprot:14352637-Alexandrium_andersonii.AAC.1
MHAVPARKGPSVPRRYWASTLNAVSNIRNGIIQRDGGTLGARVFLGILDKPWDSLGLTTTL